jgi:hypothetical protein
METKFNKYRVWALDVWGNEEEGYHVNDRREHSRKLQLPEEFTDLELLRILQVAGLLSNALSLKDIDIDCDIDETCIRIDAGYGGKPLLSLEKD